MAYKSQKVDRLSKELERQAFGVSSVYFHQRKRESNTLFKLVYRVILSCVSLIDN